MPPRLPNAGASHHHLPLVVLDRAFWSGSSPETMVFQRFDAHLSGGFLVPQVAALGLSVRLPHQLEDVGQRTRRSSPDSFAVRPPPIATHVALHVLLVSVALEKP